MTALAVAVAVALLIAPAVVAISILAASLIREAFRIYDPTKAAVVVSGFAAAAASMTAGAFLLATLLIWVVR